MAGELLNGEVRIPTIDDHTPNTGIVLFEDSEGETREIDFLIAPYGLDGRDVLDFSSPNEAMAAAIKNAKTEAPEIVRQWRVS